MNELAASVGFGLVTASVLVFAAGGFSLQFGLTNMFNFAFGQMLTVCAFIAYTVQQTGVGIIPTILATAAFGAVFSTAVNTFVYRPFARRGTGLIVLAIVSVALGTVMQYVVALIFGEEFVSIGFSQGATHRFVGMTFTSLQLEFLAFSVVAFAALHALFSYTRLGRAIRATAADPKLARACGVKVIRVVDLTWLISGAMCGIAGFYLALELGSFSYTTGEDLLPAIIAAAMVGGAGSPRAAFLGALLVGVMTEVLAAYTNPSLKQVYAFALLFIILASRPQGFLRGRAEQVVVA